MTGPAMNQGEIANAFTYHPPTGPEQVAAYEQIRAEARTLAETLVALVPPSRELSLAITHLRETVMWANAGIACHPPSAEDVPIDT